MSLCSIVKVDVSDRAADDAAARARGAARCRARCSSPPRSATTPRFERCQELGFTYFQGEYFAQPRLFRHRGVGHRRASARCAGSPS